MDKKIDPEIKSKLSSDSPEKSNAHSQTSLKRGEPSDKKKEEKIMETEPRAQSGKGQPQTKSKSLASKNTKDERPLEKKTIPQETQVHSSPKVKEIRNSRTYETEVSKCE